jgi:uncharacterized membrane protein
MRFDIWTVVRFVHVGSAILWVGGQLTLSFVVRPVTGQLFDADGRRDLISSLGSRFGRISALGLIPLLLASGIALIYHRGVTFAALAIPGYGATLGTKIVLALVSFALAAAHGMSAVNASSRAARLVGLTGTIVSLTVVLLAVSLVP